MLRPESERAAVPKFSVLARYRDPTSWKQALKTGTVAQKMPVDPNSLTLPFNSVKVDLLEVNTQKVYAELVSKLKERATVHIRFEEMFPEHNFDWKKICLFKLHWIHILTNSNINYLIESFSQIQNYLKLA